MAQRLNSRGFSFSFSGLINLIPHNSAYLCSFQTCDESGCFFFNTPASLQKIYSFLMQLHLLLANYQTTGRLLLLLFRQVYFRIMSDLHNVLQGSLCLHLSLSLHCTVTVTAGKHPLSGRCLLSGKPSVCLQLRRKRRFH